MFSEIKPCSISQLYAHPEFISSEDDLPSGTFSSKGGFLKKENFWWKFRGPCLVVFEWSKEIDGEYRKPRELARVDFSRLFDEKSITISAVTPLWDKFYPLENSNYAFTLLVALERENSGSLLCLFDAHDSKLLRRLECPFKISCMECISAYNRSGPSMLIVSEELSIMSGIVAVGTHGGMVLLIDLCLDQPQNATEEDQSEYISSKTITFLVKQGSFNNSNYDVHLKRKSALVNDQHVSYPLNKESHQKGRFLYRTENGTILSTFKSSEVSVTGIKYVPQTNSLYVGYNFGGFQFWNLKTLDLECSCVLDENLPPVIAFTYQEPENDPKDFCYIWVCRGSFSGDSFSRTTSTGDASVSSALLYLTEYSKKEWIPGYGYLYSGFVSCTCKFEYQMGVNPYSPEVSSTTCSCIVSCFVIEQGQSCPFKNSEEEGNNQDLSLCLLSWEAWDESSNITSCVYVAIFDLNPWYHCQMPSTVETSARTGNLCPFLGVFSLTEVAPLLTPDAILALRLSSSPSGHPVSKFSHDVENELTYIPCSLSFDVELLSETKVVNASFLGIQKRCLFDLSENTHPFVVNPKEFLSLCSFAGLISPKEAVKLTSMEARRAAVLSLALKYDQYSALIKLIERWASGEFSNIGCDCRFILNWIWSEVTRIKASIDESTHCLFDGSGQKLPESTHALLSSYEPTLKSLGLLIQKLAQNGTASTEQGLQELEMRKEAVELIAMYLRVILWLYHCGLLPETLCEYDDMDDVENMSLSDQVYPRSLFCKTYTNWRHELGTINPSAGLTDFLLIDGITNHLKESLESLWPFEGENSEPLYPFPSIHFIVRIYLLDSVPLDLKHMIMQYFLMDIASLDHIKRTAIAQRIELFPTFFNLKLGLSNLVQGLWAIDNKFFEFGLKSLSFSQVKRLFSVSLATDETISSLNDDLQRRLATSLLFQDRSQKALKVVCQLGLFEANTPEKERLYISILLRNGQLLKALSFQRSCRSKSNPEDILMHFFLSCEQVNLMSQLFQFPLDKVEEEGLIHYLLNQSPSPGAKHLLILFLLLNGRIIEAHQFREKYFEELMNSNDDDLCQKGYHISATINAYMEILPKPLVKVASDIFSRESSGVKDNIMKAQSQYSEDAQLPTTSKISKVDARNETVLQIVEEIEKTSTDIQANVPTETTPFREKIKQKGLFLTKNSPFIRNPINKAEPEISDSSEANLVQANLERNHDQSSSIDKIVRFQPVEKEDNYMTPARPVRYRKKTPYRSSDISKILETTPIKVQSEKRNRTPLSKAPPTPVSILKVRQDESSYTFSLPSHASPQRRRVVSAQDSSNLKSLSPGLTSSRRTIRFGFSDDESPIARSSFGEKEPIDYENIPSSDHFAFSPPKANLNHLVLEEEAASRRRGLRKMKEGTPSHSMQLRSRQIDTPTKIKPNKE